MESVWSRYVEAVCCFPMEAQFREPPVQWVPGDKVAGA
jgi:hypothetical protein